jgi:hypothetical protein
MGRVGRSPCVEGGAGVYQLNCRASTLFGLESVLHAKRSWEELVPAVNLVLMFSLSRLVVIVVHGR